jgi:hypothetical protein
MPRQGLFFFGVALLLMAWKKVSSCSFVSARPPTAHPSHSNFLRASPTFTERKISFPSMLAHRYAFDVLLSLLGDYMFAEDSGVLNVIINFTTLYLACITKRLFGLFLIATH